MVPQKFIPAIKETIKQNEIGNASPYVLSYARLGKSGASFGFMQGDTNVSSLARATLVKALAAGGVASVDSARILAAVSCALPNGNPLSAADSALANAALASNAGKAVVDAMDDQLFAEVLSGLDTCIAAAATRKIALSPLAHLYIAPWINMSGPPSLLKSWLAGQPVFGLVPPPPPEVTAEEIESYLQATSYFQHHPKNFVHYQQCVAIGAKLLP